jgi:hypothetical protein
MYAREHVFCNCWSGFFNCRSKVVNDGRRPDAFFNYLVNRHPFAVRICLVADAADHLRYPFNRRCGSVHAHRSWKSQMHGACIDHMIQMLTNFCRRWSISERWPSSADS